MGDMSARPFSHPNFGNEVRIEQDGNEVRLIFVAVTPEQAESLYDRLHRQLSEGMLNITLMGNLARVRSA